jgi:peptide subunit release factor 1 (eRF1)
VAPSSVFQKQLQKLARLPAGRHPIVSCYLKLEPRDRSRGKYRIKIKNRVRLAEQGLERLGLDRAAMEAVRADLARIQAHLDRVSNLPGAQGIALFASAGHKLFEAIPLPRVYRSRLAVDWSPQVGELAALEDELGTILTVVLDRTTARIWEVSAFAATPVADLTGNEVRGKRYHSQRGDAPGTGEHAWQGRIREERQRHYAAIADRLFELDQARPVRGVVLAAQGVEAAAVVPFLHPYLAKRVVGTTKLNPKLARAPEVLAATLAAREAHEREEERALVAELRDKLPGGWAVNGVNPTLKALAQGKVRTLLVRPDTSLAGFRCKESGRLCVTERECRLEGGGLPVLDVIDDAIEDALRQRLTVDVVYDEESARQVDGVAALLRFK